MQKYSEKDFRGSTEHVINKLATTYKQNMFKQTWDGEDKSTNIKDSIVAVTVNQWIYNTL